MGTFRVTMRPLLWFKVNQLQIKEPPVLGLASSHLAVPINFWYASSLIVVPSEVRRGSTNLILFTFLDVYEVEFVTGINSSITVHEAG